MAELKILVEGYAKKENDSKSASSAVTLIQEKGVNIIVDPGMDRNLLLKALEKEKLRPAEINFIILTHTHLDHSLLAGIFENARIMDDSEIYSWDGRIEHHKGKVAGTDVEIIKTPGHDMFHCSVLVKTEKFGRVAVVGDVFWWRANQEQRTDKESLMKHEDPYVKNKEQLMESREKILEIADYIVPGHGKMFKVEK